MKKYSVILAYRFVLLIDPYDIIQENEMYLSRAACKAIVH